MGKFVLTAELKLQAPGNINSVVNQINSRLKDIQINFKLQDASKAVSGLNDVSKAADRTAASVDKMGYAFGVSLKRFAAFSVASRAIGLFSNRLAGAIDDAINFQDQMVRLAQITGKTTGELKGVSDLVGELASNLGVTSKNILSITDILAQAGLKAKDLEVAIRALAKTELAPTFGKIEDTAEGAVAIIAQFGEGVGALERQLGSINRVAAEFAVESEDLISAVRRTGGIFKVSGGNLEELLALFTSVRATTRESAESIATGLRTIFTRIQRPQTIEYLKQFGVQLTDLNGKFVGPYQAIQQLSEALSQFGEGDVRFIAIAEELGGYRQIGKVIPLVRQFAIAEQARQVAVEGGASLDKDAATAQESLRRQFIRTQEAFLKLIRDIGNTSSFQLMVKIGLDLANAFIKIADSIKPIIPLIGALAAFKFAQGIGGFARGVGAGFRQIVGPQAKNAGGRIHRFASGGFVPGSGNRDTVPAMLTPGEFVIRKSSVNKIGADKLAAMNENRYATGGIVGEIGGVSGKTQVINSKKENVGFNLDKYSAKTGKKTITVSYNKEKQQFFANDKIITIDQVESLFANKKSSADTWEDIVAQVENGKKLTGIVGKDDRFPIDIQAANKLIDAKFREQKTYNYLDALSKGLSYRLWQATNEQFKYDASGSQVVSLDSFLNKKLKKGKDLIPDPESIEFVYPKFQNIPTNLEFIKKSLKKRRSQIKSSTTSPKQKSAAQTALLTYQDKEEISGSKDIVNNLNYYNPFKPKRKKNLGGAIQKFAAGGLANEKAVGFAVADVVPKTGVTGSTSVSIEKIMNAKPGTGELQGKNLIKALETKFSGTSSGMGEKFKSEFTKRVKAASFPKTKNYSNVVDGISGEEKTVFNDILDQESKQAILNAGNRFGNYLGISIPSTDYAPQWMLPNDEKGNLFENVLDIFRTPIGQKIEAKGVKNRPFDYTSGISLGNLFNNMKGINYVDAKATPGDKNANIDRPEFEKKIVNQLALETYAKMRPGYQPILKHFGGVIQRFARGSLVKPTEGMGPGLFSELEQTMAQAMTVKDPSVDARGERTIANILSQKNKKVKNPRSKKAKFEKQDGKRVIKSVTSARLAALEQYSKDVATGREISYTTDPEGQRKLNNAEIAFNKILTKMGYDEDMLDPENYYRLGGVIQRFATGTGIKGVESSNTDKKRKAYVFDFDDTLAETEARVGSQPNDPDKFAQFRGDLAGKLIDSAKATKIATMAKRRAERNHDIYVLTARPSEPQTIDAITRFMQRIGAPAKGILGVANMFAGEREPGKRPGTTRLLSTGSKKAKVLSQISSGYDQVLFLDDAVENLISAKGVPGVTPIIADTKSKNIVRSKFAVGGSVSSDTVGQNKNNGLLSLLEAHYMAKVPTSLIGRMVASKEKIRNNLENVESYYGVRNAKIIGSGAESVAFDIGKRVLKISPRGILAEWRQAMPAFDAPNIRGVARYVKIKQFGLLAAALQSKLDLDEKGRTKQATEEDLEKLREKISKQGYTWVDDTPFNSGYKRGKLRALDGVFRRKDGSQEITNLPKGTYIKPEKATKFAIGGPAPSDTVPALLTPGEFVINKQSAQRIGYGNLNRMNKQGVAGFASGGPVGVEKFSLGGRKRKKVSQDTDLQKNRERLNEEFQEFKKELQVTAKLTQAQISTSSKRPEVKAVVKSLAQQIIDRFAGDGVLSVDEISTIGKSANVFVKYGMIAMSSYLKKIRAGKVTPKQIQELKNKVPSVDFNPTPKDTPPVKRAAGGPAPSDTVPALLTPGEFVFSKGAAQRIGYGNLNRMNKQGVAGFASGGPVGFRFGGDVAKQNITSSFTRTFSNPLGDLSKSKKVVNDFLNQIKDVNAGVFNLVKTIKIVNETGLTSKERQVKGNSGFSIDSGNIAGRAYFGNKTYLGKRADKFTAEHETAHQIDYALGKQANPSGNQIASKTPGTFQNKVALELQKSLAAEGNQSAYRLDLGELWADAMAKAPPEVKKILASTTDAAKGSKLLAEYFEKAGGPAEGLADLSADEFGGIQDPKKRAETEKEVAKQTRLAAQDAAKQAKQQIPDLDRDILKSQAQRRSAVEKKIKVRKEKQSAELYLREQKQIQLNRRDDVDEIRKKITKNEAEKKVYREKNDSKGLERALTEEKQLTTELNAASKALSKSNQEIIKFQKETQKLSEEIQKQTAESKKAKQTEADLNKKKQNLLNEIAKQEKIIKESGKKENQLNIELGNKKAGPAARREIYKNTGVDPNKRVPPGPPMPPGGGLKGGGSGGSGGSGNSGNTKDAATSFVAFSAFTTAINSAGSALVEFGKNADGTSTVFSRLVETMVKLTNTVGIVVFALQQFGVKLSLKSFGSGPDSIGQQLFGKMQKSLQRPQNVRQKLQTQLSSTTDPARQAILTQRLNKLPGGSKIAGGFANVLGSLSAAAGPLAAVAASAVRVTTAFNGVIGAIYNFKDQIESAVKAGDIEKAGQLAEKQYEVDAANSLRTAGIAGGAAFGAAIGSFVPVIGTAIGGLIGALLGGLTATIAAFFSPKLAEFVNVLFGGDTMAVAKARVKVEAALNYYSDQHATNLKNVDAATKQWETGLLTTGQALQVMGNNAMNAAIAMREASTLINELETQKAGGSKDFLGQALDISTMLNPTGLGLRALGFSGRDIGSMFTAGYIENDKTRNASITKQQTEAQNKAVAPLITEFNALTSVSNPLINSLIVTSDTYEEVMGKIKNSSLGAATVLEEYEKQIEKATQLGNKSLADKLKGEKIAAEGSIKAAIKAAENQRRFIETLSSGLYGVVAGAEAAGTQLELIAMQTEGVDALTQSMKILEASITNQAAAMDPKQTEAALSNFASALRSAGADEATIKRNVTNLQATSQLQAGLAQDIDKEALKQAAMKGEKAGPEAIKQLIKETALKNVTDENQRAVIDVIVSNLETEKLDLNKLRVGDTSEIRQKASDLAAQAEKDAINAGNVLAKRQQELGAIILKRIEVEKQAADAASNAVDVGLEMARLRESFGGPKVTRAQRQQAIVQRGLNALRGTGIGIGTGSAKDFAGASAQVQGELVDLEKRKAAGTFGAAEKQRETQLLQSQSALIDATKQRLELAKEEAEIAKKKVSLEKSAFEKLLGGDILGAIEDMQASAAASVLQAGDTGLAGLFGGKALLGGLKQLEETGASAEQKQAAARTAGRTLGLSSVLADAFAGTTPQEIAANQDVVNTSRIIEQQARDQAVLAEERLKTALANEERAKAQVLTTAQTPILPSYTAAPPVPQKMTPEKQQTGEEKLKSAVQNGIKNFLGIPSNPQSGQVATAGAGISPEVVNMFSSSVNNFVAAVDKLQNLKLSVQVDATNVNVNLNGGTFLNTLSAEVRNSVLDAVANEIPKYKVGIDGKLSKGGIVG